jgi:tetratricopeptide (TPR) repeat protein
MGRKLGLVWHRVELGDAEDPYTHASWSTVLRVTLPVLHFGTLAPLALLGIWTTWDRRRRLRPLYWMLAVYPLSVVLFYVFGRYRYPVVGLLALFAGAGLVESPRFFRAAGAGRRLAAGLTVAGMTIACNWPTDSEARARASTLYNVGVWVGRRPERSSEAIAWYERSLAIRPDTVEALYNLANALKRSGDLARAEASYRRVLALAPELAAAHNNLGESLEARGARAQAIESYRRAVELDPALWEARGNLGLALGRDGHVGEAVDALRAAMRIRPESATLHYNLGTVLAENGRMEEAVGEYRRALELDPSDPRAHNNLGYALAALGRLDEAAAACSEALRLDPDYAAARTNLAAIRAARGG